jgi:hypothetical protein
MKSTVISPGILRSRRRTSAKPGPPLFAAALGVDDARGALMTFMIASTLRSHTRINLHGHEIIVCRISQLDIEGTTIFDEFKQFENLD